MLIAEPGLREKRIRGLLVAIACAVATVLQVGAAFADALNPNARFEFRIEQETLGGALDALARQADVRLLYPYELASTTGVNPVVGQYSVTEALEIMLQGTNFSGGLVEGGVLLISQNNGQETESREKDMSPRGKRRGLFAGISALVFSASGVGQISDANAAVDEIIVTATKRGAASAQDISIAVTAFDTNYLDRSAVSDIRDLSQVTPGLFVSENSGLAQVYIRGVGTNNVFAGGDPSSTIHLDGVYLGRPSGVFNNFLDVERIEVLRGPQGTLYGRNSVGGTINIVSRKPSLEEFGAKAQLTVGNYDHIRGEAHVSGPIIPGQLAVSLAGQYSRRDGYRENIVLIGNDPDDQDSVALRGQILFQPNEALEIIIRGDYFTDSYVPYGFGTFVEPPTAPVAGTIFGDFDKVAHNMYAFGSIQNYGVSAEINYTFGENWSVKSLTAYRDKENQLAADTDASEITGLFTNISEKQDQISQEFNLVRNGDQFDVILGAYFLEENIDQSPSRVSVFGPGIQRRPEPIVETTVWALFGEARWQFTESLAAIFGLRYSDEKKSFIKNDGIFVLGTDIQIANLSFPEESASFNAFTPKFGLEFAPTDDLLLYATVSRGFKSGGFNFTAVLPGGYDEETLWAYEAGVKSDWLDGRLRANLAAFYYDYNDLQVQAFVVPGQTDVSNAASAKVKGLELELTAKPVPQIDIIWASAYLDAEYEDYPDAPVFGGPPADASGNQLNFSPKFSTSIRVQYVEEVSFGEVFANAEYNWQGESFFTADNNSVDRQKSYGMLNGKLGDTVLDGQLDFSVWARNLTNQEYVTGTAQFPLPGRAGRAGFPRTFGVRLTWQMQ